ncbi:ulp1 protease family, C-terminal catalytic domain-containing protein [Artemisia annua]|uniref:Ulp1 protease family, C-terminal catalytic domain-containing protein n=1 Tax=Artemisia annua TaxID=35608 RepID=A0A2U1NEM2_ARTAN|nr:ulp1 protease family, C-terminal catalytic domain-containing protein [Artemisia annua]
MVLITYDSWLNVDNETKEACWKYVKEISQKASANRKRNKWKKPAKRKRRLIGQNVGKKQEKRKKEEILKKDKDYSEDPIGSLDLLTEALGTEETRGRQKAVEDELERRRCASTNASEGASNSPTLSDEDEEPNVPSEPNLAESPSHSMLWFVAVEEGKSTETLASIAEVTEKGNPLKKMMTRGQKRVRKRIEERMALKMTAMMVDGQVAKVDCIKVQCEDDLFGHRSYTYLNWNDFDSLFSMDELSGAVVASYIMYLYEQIKNGSQRDHGVCFMTPTAIMHHERKARAKNIEEASQVIAKRLSTRKQNDLILLPYNPGRHWVLGVLNMKTSTCYYLDSLSIGGDSNEYTDADFDDIRDEWTIYVSNFIFM